MKVKTYDLDLMEKFAVPTLKKKTEIEHETATADHPLKMVVVWVAVRFH